MGIRVNKAMTILNIGTETVIEYLKSRPRRWPSCATRPTSARRRRTGKTNPLSYNKFEGLRSCEVPRFVFNY